MSFKLFIASTFGLIKPTVKIEAAHDALLADYLSFCEFEKSNELKEYHALEILVNSATFKQKKKELQHLVLKGSKEDAQLIEFKKLERNSRLQKYYSTLKSEELKRFAKISESGMADKFQALKKYVGGSEFQNEKKNAEARGKKKFETTEAFARLNELKKLQNSDDLKSYIKFEKSTAHRNYEQMKNSAERKRFEELQKISGLEKSASKDSKEAVELSEYIKLKKNSRLQKFFATQKSEEFKRFEKISESGVFDKFQVLKKYVGSIEFQNEKKKAEIDGKKEFENTDAFAKLQEYKKLQTSEDVKFYLTFEKSALRRNYEQMKDSVERKRLEELQKIILSEEFKARVAYLEDKQKWEKTDESVQEKKFAEFQKLPLLVNYLKYKNSNAFDFFKKWNLVFEDRFETGKLDPQKWINQSYWASQALGQNFSQVGDLHAFTDGKNVLVDGKSLKLEVRKEKAKGMQWQIPFGFVEHEFEYTSGIVSTADAEWWKHGILEAKVKYSPSKNIIDAFYLLGEESSPQINLVEMGIKNRVGLLNKTAEGIHAESESISGLKPGEFYIFRLEWSANSLIWTINGREILTVSQNVPAFKMHMNAASIVVTEPTESLPHRFEIDWVRFYQHHKS